MRNNNENYFQFPLCALAFGDAEVARLDHIISFGCVDAGYVMLNRLSPESRKEVAIKFSQIEKCPAGFSKSNPNHIAAMLGAEAIGVTFGNIGYSVESWNAVSNFKRNFEAKHGRDVEVRIAKTLAFEVRDKAGMSYREFAALSAIYSCVGAKEYPVRVTRDRIQCRMLGYKTADIMRAEISNRTDGATPLSLRQINYTLDKLHERQFFARARANERQTFYSHRLSQAALEDALITGKSYSAKFHNCRRERDSELMAKIQEGKAAIRVDAPIKVDTAPNDSPN